MLRIGLTGGIGCGKSTVLKLFQHYGASTIDADKESRALMNVGQATLKQVIRHFGMDYQLSNGELDRKKLGEKVFSNSQYLRELEAITHPAINARILALMDAVDSQDPYVIVDIPLLFEKSYQSLFDSIVVVDCNINQQYERVMKRDAKSYSQVKAIISQQMSLAVRKKYANYVIVNQGSLESLQEQVELLHHQFVGN
ncbi:MAG: dephospho-CoA kinase [Thiotrichaceae bacterium]|nr:dephospho-CoA kinase [Thiotrichaceae bacterium]